MSLLKRLKNKIQVWCIEFGDKYCQDAINKAALDSQMIDIQKLTCFHQNHPYMDKLRDQTQEITVGLRGAFLCYVEILLEKGYHFNEARAKAFKRYENMRDD